MSFFVDLLLMLSRNYFYRNSQLELKIYKVKTNRSISRNKSIVRAFNMPPSIFDMQNLSLLRDIKDLNAIGKLDLIVIYRTIHWNRGQQTGPDSACGLFLDEILAKNGFLCFKRVMKK